MTAAPAGRAAVPMSRRAPAIRQRQRQEHHGAGAAVPPPAVGGAGRCAAARLLTSSQPPSRSARSAMPRKPNEVGFCRSAARMPRPLSAISSESWSCADDQADVDPARAGVLDDVGQRFLQRAIGGEGERRGHRHRSALHWKLDGHAAAPAGVVRKPAQRRNQTLVEHRRPQALLQAQGGVHHLRQRLHRLARRGRRWRRRR